MTPWAIIVGIDRHPPQAELNDLFGAVADAADFAEWALAPNGGGVEPARLFFWTYPAPPARAIGPLLEAYLEAPTPWPLPPNGRRSAPPDMGKAPTSGDFINLVSFLQGEASEGFLNKKVNRCFVFLAGHGVEITDDTVTETCFLAGDYANGTGFVPCDEMNRALQSKGFAQVLMFLDCCRTLIPGDMPIPRMFGVAKKRSLTGVGRAAAPNGTSYEVPQDDPKRGAFTHALTDKLRTFRDANDVLTFRDLGLEVEKRVPELLGRGRSQEPQFGCVPPNTNPPLIVVSGPAAILTAGVVITFRTVPPGTVVDLMDNSFNPVGPPIVSTAQPMRLSVPTGGVYMLKPVGLPGGKAFPHFGPGDSHVEL